MYYDWKTISLLHLYFPLMYVYWHFHVFLTTCDKYLKILELFRSISHRQRCRRSIQLSPWRLCGNSPKLSVDFYSTDIQGIAEVQAVGVPCVNSESLSWTELSVPLISSANCYSTTVISRQTKKLADEGTT